MRVFPVKLFSRSTSPFGGEKAKAFDGLGGGYLEVSNDKPF